MKQHDYLTVFEEKVLQILNDIQRIKPMFKKLRAAFNEIQLIIPLAKPVTIQLVETESLRFSVFYQSIELSKHAIVIAQQNYKNYLWFDNNELSLNDDTFEKEEIAKILALVPVLSNYPESVKDLYWLIQFGLWSFSNSRLPKFTDNPPRDTDEVLSWDKSHLLIGTSFDNFEIVSRDYWDDLCQREDNWFKN